MRSILVRSIVLVFAVGLMTRSVRAEDPPAWVDLFNGKDLSGWTASGDQNAWGVRDGEIVTIRPGHGGWLRTTRMYRDFELTLEFWMPEGGNSGVGLRGSSNGDPAFTGFEIQILDTSGQSPDVRNCGSVYEAFPARVMAVRPAGSWNNYRIRLVGSHLSVWLNGEQIHDMEPLDDRGFYRTESQPLPLHARATTGYIALQDHGHAFRFRNIRLLDLSPDPEPLAMRSLMDMDLWFTDGGGSWSIEGGTLIGRDGPGHLFTHESFRNLELRSLVRVNERGNSGIYFRASPNPRGVWPIGVESQIDNHDRRNFTGCLYDRAWPSRSSGPMSRDDAWFDYRVLVEGARVRTWINGKPVVVATLPSAEECRVALQTHHEGNRIEFRDLRILVIE